MTPKWTIRKYAVSSLGDEVALPWLLFEPGVSPPKLFHEAYWAACSMGETPSEVLAYIKSQTCKARTVTLTLPTVNPDQSIQGDYEGSFPLRVRRNWYGGTSLSIPGARTFAITPEEREKLALYLLAEHYHHKRNQND